MQALVVDDSRTTRLVLKHLLTQLGFQVAEAANGQEGLDQLDRLGQPDLVLVDWHMPEMDGLTFVRAVRANPRHTGLPLVMVTGEEDASQLSAAREAGANEHVRKPFTREQLLAKLDRLGIAVG